MYTTTLIISTYNKMNRLRLTLDTLKRLFLRKPLQLIIIDDGSTDDTWDLLCEFSNNIRSTSHLKILIMHQENAGRSIARNNAALKADGDLLIFSDDDLLLDPMFVENHINFHNKNLCCVVHGRIFDLPYLKFFPDPQCAVLINGSTAGVALRRKVLTSKMLNESSFQSYLKENTKLGKFEKDICDLLETTNINESDIRWISCTGGNLSVKRKLFFNSGTFDANLGKLWGCEDLELGYRLYLHGAQFLSCPTAINYHMNHFRDNAFEEHDKSFHYFSNKYNDKTIGLLNEYFMGSLSSLIEWYEKVQYYKQCNYQ